jgi:hypothetical protein
MNFDRLVNKVLVESDYHFSDTGNIRRVRYSDTERGKEKGHDPEGERYDRMIAAQSLSKLAEITADIRRAQGSRPYTYKELKELANNFTNKGGGLAGLSYSIALRDPELRQAFTRYTGVVQPGYEEEGIVKVEPTKFVIRNKKTGRIMNDRNDKSKYAKFNDAQHARNVISKFQYNREDLEPVDSKELSPEERSKIV